MHAVRSQPRSARRSRPYDMRERGRHAARTRTAILDAAHALLDRPDGGGLTLDEVARAAGVSRATTYNQFGSRRNLLAAVFEDQGRRIGYASVLAALRLGDPEAALIGVVRESCRAWATGPLAIRRTLALAVLDPEVGELVTRYEGYRRAEFAALGERLAAAGLLPANVLAADATAILCALTSFQAFDLLLAGGATAAADRLSHLAVQSLIVPHRRSNP